MQGVTLCCPSHVDVAEEIVLEVIKHGLQCKHPCDHTESGSPAASPPRGEPAREASQTTRRAARIPGEPCALAALRSQGRRRLQQAAPGHSASDLLKSLLSVLRATTLVSSPADITYMSVPYARGILLNINNGFKMKPRPQSGRTMRSACCRGLAA